MGKIKKKKQNFPSLILLILRFKKEKKNSKRLIISFVREHRDCALLVGV